jgi:hypothetical protein
MAPTTSLGPDENLPRVPHSERSSTYHATIARTIEISWRNSWRGKHVPLVWKYELRVFEWLLHLKTWPLLLPGPDTTDWFCL